MTVWVNVINRVGRVVDPPFFHPPMTFEIEKANVSLFVYEGVPISTEILTFHHDEINFQITTEINLTEYDVHFVFLVCCFIIL